MGGNSVAAWSWIFRWAYILKQAKERSRRSAVTHKSKSSLPSLENKGVETASVQTKKTCDLWGPHVSQPSETLTKLWVRFRWFRLPAKLGGPVTPNPPVWAVIGFGPQSGPILSTREQIFITHWTTQRLCYQIMGRNLRNRDNFSKDERKSFQRAHTAALVGVQERTRSNLTLVPGPRV